MARPASRRDPRLRAERAPPADTDTLLRELNHRVKNNLQIIASLMNLRKRALPGERPGDIRFIEEHVQSMSVAYRLGYASEAIGSVPLSELVTDVLSGLRKIAGLGDDRLRIEMTAIPARLGLDHAVALALYLAVLVPPFLDHALATSGLVTVTAVIAAGLATLTVRGDWNEPIVPDFLRGRLMRAHAVQLGADVLGHGNVEEQIRFALVPV
jgi:two-component sensor histidine kinase